MMNPIDMNAAVASALQNLLTGRLAVLAGAGLSMAPPSSLPNAWTLAKKAKRKYDAQFAGVVPPLPALIEEQAEFFFQKGQLGSVYLTEYIDHSAFAGAPNPGHFAVADLLLAGAFRMVITTNVDPLIEAAGLNMQGQVFMGIDGNYLARAPASTAPLLKIHGCWVTDKFNTVWAPSQLAASPVRERIEQSATWLQANLLNKDLVVVGYSTDWDYLNAVLERALGAVAPSTVLIVDPSSTADFVAKAPQLAMLAGRSTTGASHLQASGADFLEALRRSYSEAFVRVALAQGAVEFEMITGSPPNPVHLMAPTTDIDSLWRMRRDLLGCGPQDPARDRDPPDEPVVGLTILELRAAGATPDGSYWRVNGRTVRVLRAPNAFLHRIEADFAREVAPVAAADVVVAVGAADLHLHPSIARSSPGTIARGGGSRWVTRDGLRDAIA
jgi:hypothetical protein